MNYAGHSKRHQGWLTRGQRNGQGAFKQTTKELSCRWMLRNISGSCWVTFFKPLSEVNTAYNTKSQTLFQGRTQKNSFKRLSVLLKAPIAALFLALRNSQGQKDQELE